MQIEVEAIEEAVTDLSLRNQSCKFRGNQAPGVDAIVQGEAQQGCWGPPRCGSQGVPGLGCPGVLTCRLATVSAHKEGR